MRSRARVGAKVVASAVTLAVATGCQEQGRGPQSSSRDSLGVRITLTDLRDAALIPSCSMGAEPALRIGRQMGDMAQELSGVTDAMRLADGRILALDNGSHQVRVFDAAGRPLAQLGREGDGPGEFRNPVEMSVLAGDSVAVWDVGLRRVSVFDINGGDAREIALNASAAQPTAQFGVLDGDFIVGSKLTHPSEGADLVQQGLELLRYSRTGLLLDTLKTLPSGRAGWVVAGGARRFGSPLFDSQALFAANGTLLYATDGAAPSVEAMEPSGRAVAAVRWDPADLTVTDAELGVFRQSRLEGADARTRNVLEQWFEAMPVARAFPASASIRATSQGGLWVKAYQRPSEDSETWMSFDADGEFQCRGTFAPRFTAMEFGEGWVLGVRRDDLDVEYLEVWDLGGQ